MAQQSAATALNSREAIVDVLQRALLALDTNDRDLFESAWLKNEDMSYVAGESVIKGWTAYSEFYPMLFDLVTTHYTSNIRVELSEGADTASLTAHSLAYHIRPGKALGPEDTSFTVGSLFYVDLIKQGIDGAWKMKKFEIKTLWTTGDRSILVR